MDADLNLFPDSCRRGKPRISGKIRTSSIIWDLPDYVKLSGGDKFSHQGVRRAAVGERIVREGESFSSQGKKREGSGGIKEDVPQNVIFL